MIDQHIFDWLTLTVAASGLTLGVINLVCSFLRTRVRLRVVPKAARVSSGVIFSQSKGDLKEFNNVVMEVVNLSEFPVYVAEVGFKYVGSDLRSLIANPLSTNKCAGLPIRLDARESTTVFAESEDALRTLRSFRVKAAYVKTDCGKTVVGTSRPFRMACNLLYRRSSGS